MKVVVHAFAIAIISAALIVTGALVWGASAQDGGVSGVVFFDKDANGARGSGEPGLAGVTVELRDGVTGGQAIRLFVQTSSDGSYHFEGLSAGAYTVAVLVADPFTTTTTSPQAVTVESAPMSGADFGVTILQTVTGTEFNDIDGDGAKGRASRASPAG